MAICGKIILNSLKRCPGEVSLPGIRPKAYAIPKSDIVKWPVLGENDGTDAAVTYKGDFVLLAEKKWAEIDIISNKSPVTMETQGESESQSVLNKVSLKVPSTGKKATAFARTANASDLVYIVQDKAGNYRVVGNEANNTLTKVGQVLGATATDDSGTTIEIEVTDCIPAPFYEGKIEVEDGIIGEKGEE